MENAPHMKVNKNGVGSMAEVRQTAGYFLPDASEALWRLQSTGKITALQ